MTKNRFIGLTLFIILLSLGWFIMTPIIFPTNSANAETAPHRGFTAPDFTLTTPEGEIKNLTQYRGKPVLVLFWASWCSVCKRIMPDIQAVYEDYELNGFEVLAINTTYQDTLGNAVNTIKAMNYDFELLLDLDGSVSETYQVFALPTAVLVGADGQVQDVVIGSGMSEGYLRSNLNNLLQDLQ